LKSASSHRRLSFAQIATFLLLAAGLGGCGTDIISYNREFREHGFVQYNQQDYLNAAQTFKLALRDEPGDYTSRSYLGNCYEFMGHPLQAIKEYRTTLNVMTTSLEGKGDVVTRSKVLNSMAEAIAKEPDRSGDLAVIERQPRTTENAILLARIYRLSGDADLAMTRYQEAEQLDPKDASIPKEYGFYLEGLGQTRRADAQLRQAFALNTHDEEVAAHLRGMGVVPGPSLKTEDGLEKPLVPLGPLPEVEFTTSSKQPAQPQQFPKNAGVSGIQTAPQD
jgi:tetratricopeptide (TPR) repeat protein